MKVSVKNGRYILAVSGGLDSMILLDILSKRPGLELVVAHFNHGIRADSNKDEKLVSSTAKKYGFQLEVGQGRLGKEVSEAVARQARYDFLEKVRLKHQALAIVTAHHQDDLIETAFLNILRGSGPTGMTAIVSNSKVLRPLINIPRQEIEDYARENHIGWREDATNNSDIYLRNYLRRTLKMTPPEREKIISEIEKVAKTTKEKDKLIATISHHVTNKDNIKRSRFASLPQEVAGELVRYWLRAVSVADIDRKTIHRLSIGLKTARLGTRLPVKKGIWLNFDIQTAYFTGDNPVRKLQLYPRPLKSQR